MHENILKNIDIMALEKEYGVLKRSKGNYRCRKCLMTDGYSDEEKRCRWCGQDLFEMDKV
ncbi:MAG: hypothetical protein NC923_01400 [Candidatus Omnitrophica bacterium]|nr:hypothetical protein [Candidatus Omnitrophota bacterium]